MTSKHWITTILLSLTVALGHGYIYAADAPAAEDIAQWVKDLDSDEFATRQSAQQKLERAGQPAIAAVREAALGESQEAAVRAIEILQKHVRGEDAELKQAAQKTLKDLADGDNEIVAQRANSALEPPKTNPDQAQQNDQPIGPRVIPLGGRGGIRIEARAIAIGGDGARRVTMKNVDGNKEIDIEEKDRKIKIVETAEGKITMKITGEEGDMDASKEIEADSAEDLKKKDPEAHKIYEKYSKGGVGGGRIEFRALPAGPRGVPRIRLRPAVPRGGAEIPADIEAEIEARFKEALERLEEAQKQFEGDDAFKDGAQERIKQLKKMQEQLQKQIEGIQADIEKEVEDAKE